MDLLGEMSAGVARTPSATETEVWLATSRALEEDLEHARPLVAEAVAFLRVDPFGRKTASVELSHALAALTHSVAQVRAIARTLFDHQLEGAPRLPASLAEVLARTAVAYRARRSRSRKTARAWTPPSMRSGRLAASRFAAFAALTRPGRGWSPGRS